MKAILIVQDVDIATGEVYTNKGLFTNDEWDYIWKTIDQRSRNSRHFCDVKFIKNGWILRNVEEWISHKFKSYSN